MDYKKKYLKYKKKYLDLKGGNLIYIPIYRFVKPHDPNILISRSELEPKSLEVDVDDYKMKILFHEVIYKIPCYQERNNNVHEYLAGNPYGGTTNIIGFLKYEDEPLDEFTRERVLNPQDYRFWSNKFRRNRSDEDLNRNVFITNYKQLNENDQLKIQVGQKTIFNNIKCPESGIGRDEKKIYDWLFGEDTIEAKEATCDHPNYPEKGCPSIPVVANLGSLMPSPNGKEINFIGNSYIRGLLVIAVAKVVSGKTRKYIQPPLYLKDRNKEHLIDKAIDKFLNNFNKNPVNLNNLLESSTFVQIEQENDLIR
jgi:hypothetical protein